MNITNRLVVQIANETSTQTSSSKFYDQVKNHTFKNAESVRLYCLMKKFDTMVRLDLAISLKRLVIRKKLSHNEILNVLLMLSSESEEDKSLGIALCYSPPLSVLIETLESE